jgi:hypothetical protein
MIVINTLEFSGYCPDTFFDFLQFQNQKHFEIRFAKFVIAGKDDPLDIFWEYHLVAYAGHQLSQVVENFAYYVPSVYKKDTYKFDVQVKKLEPFARLLFNIILAFHQYGSEEQIQSFQVEASEFFINAYAHKIEPSTWGMLSIANQFLCNNFPR